MRTRIVLVFVAGLLGSLSFGQTNAPYELKRVSDSRAGYYKATSNYIATTASGVPRLAVDSNRKAVMGTRSEFLKNAKEFFRDFPKKPFAEYMLTQKTTVSAFTKEIASYSVERVEYSGGAHENTWLLAATFGLVNGKPTQLSWRHVFDASKASDLKNVVLEPIMVKKHRMDPQMATPILEDKMFDNFIVSPYGVTWLFGQGELGAQSEGTFVAKVPWSKLAGLVKANSPIASYLANNTIYSNWTLVEFQGMDDSTVKVNKGLFTLSVNLDGSVTGRADVNRFSGHASIDGSSVVITLGPTTLAMPPAGSFHDRYLSYLPDVRSATMKNGDLFLALKMDGGILHFKRGN